MHQLTIRLADTRHSAERVSQSKPRRIVDSTELLARLLCRLARRVMADITIAPANTVPAHMARLADVCDMIDHALQHGLVTIEERGLSGMQLANPSTVMDYRAALDITKQNHRSPCFINPNEQQHKEIMRRLDIIASYLNKKDRVHDSRISLSHGTCEEGGVL